MRFYTCVNRHGNNILYRGYDLNTRDRIQEKHKFQPTLYLPDLDGECTALDGTKVAARKFESMRGAWEFVEAHKDIQNLEVYGNQNYVTQFIQERHPGVIPFDRSVIRIGYIDIEVQVGDTGFPHPDRAEQPVTAISFKISGSDEYIVWGVKDYDPSSSSYDVRYVLCSDEADLLERFLDHWDSPQNSLDIITGWNIQLFDIPYLVNRIQMVLGEDASKRMSPWRVVKNRRVMMMKRPREAYELYGIQQLDYLDLFKKFGYTYGEQENYRLDTIANTVLGEKKISYDDYTGLDDLYRRDYQLFIEYNIRDTELVSKIEDKLGLIGIAMDMAYKGGVNYSDTFGTTMIWDSIIYRKLMGDGIIVPPNRDTPKGPYDGGYVKAIKPGMYQWVVSLDLDSLYPNIIVQQNMSPETMVGKRDDINVSKCLDGSGHVSGDYSIAANGAVFRTDTRGVIPGIIDSYYSERKNVKGRMIKKMQDLEKVGGSDPQIEKDIAHLENEQMAIKILLNSLYGALANRYFRYFSMPVAEGITASGRLAIQWAERAVNQYLNSVLGSDSTDYVIAIDTDSLYINMGPLIDRFDPKSPVDFLDKVCSDKIEGVIKDAYADMYSRYGGYENRMNMTREVIADRGIWTAKKRYILNVHDSEGVRYTRPKIKIKGIEAIKSSTPSACREALKEIFTVIMTGTEEETQDAIRRFKAQFRSLPPEEISFPRGVSDIEKWQGRSTEVYKKGTPIHVRGALTYNRWVHKNGGNAHPLISNGDKIKFVYLRTPNPVRENVVAYPAYLPREMGLHRYIDHAKQFQKAFVDVLAPIFDAIGWSVDRQVSLKTFMGGTGTDE